MNRRFMPEHPFERIDGTADKRHSAAIVTASYAPDFERCRLLCESIDRHVTGFERHYILVEGRDVALFRQLETSRRIVVDERDLLPTWLRAFDDPLSRMRRRVWLSRRVLPLRGWHVQQLRRIGIAQHSEHEALVYCDSDVVFLKPFDCGDFWLGDKLRLFRRDNALVGSHESDQKTWSRNAGAVLGIAEPEVSPHDYISTVIAWRREAVVAMCERIEQVRGVDWVRAVAARRKFSECMIYGRFVDEVRQGAGHFTNATEFCRVRWANTAMSDDDIRAFIDAMEPQQVAIGMQSYLGADLQLIRSLIVGA